MRDLLLRTQRFTQTEHYRHEDLFTRLQLGQKPPVLWICCSDSRIAPHLLTQSEPGTLFVVRNPGNIVPDHESDCGAAAAIEYAVKALGVESAVVCGHLGCGAVAAACQPETTKELPAMARWASRIQIDGCDSDRVVERNVVHQLQRLHAYPCVAEAIAGGHLQTTGWVYDIGAGDIRILDGDAFTDIDDYVRRHGHDHLPT